MQSLRNTRGGERQWGEICKFNISFSEAFLKASCSGCLGRCFQNCRIPCATAITPLRPQSPCPPVLSDQLRPSNPSLADTRSLHPGRDVRATRRSGVCSTRSSQGSSATLSPSGESPRHDQIIIGTDLTHCLYCPPESRDASGAGSNCGPWGPWARCQWIGNNGGVKARYGCHRQRPDCHPAGLARALRTAAWHRSRVRGGTGCPSGETAQTHSPRCDPLRRMAGQSRWFRGHESDHR